MVKAIIEQLIRVAVIEDDTLTRRSLATLLSGADGFACVSAYATGEEAVARLPIDQPEVVLMDISLPEMSGVECVRRLKQSLPEVQIIMLTLFEDEDMVFDALQAGATGFLSKRIPAEEILQAIQEVVAGGSPMSSFIARKVISILQSLPPIRFTEPKDQAHLSPRESEILNLVATGQRNKEIACQLGINMETVRTHLRRTFDKLQVTSRTEAAIKYLRRTEWRSS